MVMGNGKAAGQPSPQNAKSERPLGGTYEPPGAVATPKGIKKFDHWAG